MKRLIIILVFVLVGVTAGCARDDRAWVKADSWYVNAPPQAMPGAKELSPSCAHEVVVSSFPEVEYLLRDTPVVELTDEQAAKFIGGPLQKKRGTKPYLVRALYLNMGTGAFKIATDANTVFIAQGCLGKHSLPMKRTAFVLQLERKPTKVYHSCEMAE